MSIEQRIRENQNEGYIPDVPYSPRDWQAIVLVVFWGVLVPVAASACVWAYIEWLM